MGFAGARFSPFPSPQHWHTGTFTGLLGLGQVGCQPAKQRSVLCDAPDTRMWVRRGTADERNLPGDLQRGLKNPDQWGADFYWESTERPSDWTAIPNKAVSKPRLVLHLILQVHCLPVKPLSCCAPAVQWREWTQVHWEEKTRGKPPITSEPEGKGPGAGRKHSSLGLVVTTETLWHQFTLHWHFPLLLCFSKWEKKFTHFH